MEIQKAGARGHNSAFFRKKCGFRVVARKRITALQVSPGSPASRSSWLGQRGAHPHRDQQNTTVHPVDANATQSSNGQLFGCLVTGVGQICFSPASVPTKLDAAGANWTQDLGYGRHYELVAGSSSTALMFLFPWSTATTCKGLVSGRYTTMELGNRDSVQNLTGRGVISVRLEPSRGCLARLVHADRIADSTRFAALTLSSAM